MLLASNASLESVTKSSIKITKLSKKAPIATIPETDDIYIINDCKIINFKYNPI